MLGSFGLLADEPVEDLVVEALSVLSRDFDGRLGRVDAYLRGEFDDPYSPEGMSGETRSMMRRAKQNWCEIPVNAAVQALAVDGFRPGVAAFSGGEALRLAELPEWEMWQRSNLDAKQSVVHRAAIAYGQGFVLSELGADGMPYARVLSALRTVMLFEDALSDDNAVLAVSVIRYPRSVSGGRERPGLAIAWDRFCRYEVSWGVAGGSLVVSAGVPHGGRGHCPVTRFVSQMDDEGRVVGSVEPLIRWQDTFNQMLFNLLVTQSKDAHRILWATGMQPAPVLDENGAPVVDASGNQKFHEVKAGPGDFLVNTDGDGKFGYIPGGEQAGYIAAMDMLVKDFSALSQTPPNFLLGQMANLSADALNAAEKSFSRKLDLYRRQFGESWERVLRVGMIVAGEPERDHWEHNEVVWSDMEAATLSQTADALSKLREIGVPARGLWRMVPGVSPAQLDEWGEAADAESQSAEMMRSIGEFQSVAAGSDPFVGEDEPVV